MAEMKSTHVLAYISDNFPFRGYHITIARDGCTENGGELGNDYPAAIEKMERWADANGYTNLGGGAWEKQI